jgi:hypothetical protein
MGNTPETPSDPRERLIKEYEDPHYHDEDEIAPVSDEPFPRHSTAAPSRPARRLPPPRRRFYED